MPKDESERSASNEIQYWKNLNNIGCLNPEACDRQVKKFLHFPQNQHMKIINPYLGRLCLTLKMLILSTTRLMAVSSCYSSYPMIRQL